MMMDLFGITPQESKALWLSLKVGMAAVVLTAVPGIFCGWLLAKKRFFGKTLFDGIVHLPLVLPPVVTGYLLLLTFSRGGFIGKFLDDVLGIEIAFTWKGAAIASAIMGFPLMVRAVRISMEAVSPRMEQAAQSLGASPLKVFFSVTLPLSMPGVFSGMMLSFARSLGEFGATVTFVSNIPGITQTLPLAIFTFSQISGGEDAAIRLVILSILLSLGALIASEVMVRKAKSKSGNI